MDSGRKGYTFFWSIENFSFCWHKDGERLRSPYFNTYGLESKAWTLLLKPRCIYDGKRYISLHLQRPESDDEPKNVSIKFELSVLAADGSALSSKEYDCSFGKRCEQGDNYFLKMDQTLLERNYPQDILTVRCKIWGSARDVHRVAHIYARTRIGIEKISFLHVVEKFSSLEPNQKHTIKIQSHSQKESSLYFTHSPCFAGDMIVEITPADSSHILSKLKLFLVVSGNAILCAKEDNRFNVARRDIGKLCLSLTRQAILNMKSEYLPDDKLSLQFECSFSTGLEYGEIEETQYEIPLADAKRTNKHELSKNDDDTSKKASAYPSALEDMKSLYVDQCLSDVELKTKTKSFPAHKSVLCARSPVFKRMMTCDMKEKNADCVQVDDLGDDVVQRLLLFLYSDTVESLQWEMATQLYYAADKYQVGKLKEVCSSFLIENLTPTNAGELLLLADTHSESDLKKVVEDFILEHEKEVFGSDEWEMLMEKNPLLVMKTMQLKYKR